MNARNALKLILSLNDNPDGSIDKVELAPMTRKQVKDALAEMDANDPRVRIVRSDPKVGNGSCTSIDEAYTDTELVDAMNEDDVTTKNARQWARELEGLRLEQGLNQRWGEDSDPQLKAYNEFHDLDPDNGKDRSLDHLIYDGMGQADGTGSVRP